MDTKQIEYILKIAEENNITKAAEKLFITQSALNQQLLKLEKELGTPLFHRSRANWGLTEAGRIYVEGAKAALQIKKTTYNQIYDVANAKRGHLSIGLTPGRGLRMFTAIYPELHRSYPNLEVKPIEMRVRAQQTAIAKGEIDVGFMTLHEKDRTNDVYVNLGTEELMLIIPSGHPVASKAAPAGEPFATLDIRELKYEPFVLMDKNSTLRAVCDTIFDRAGFAPNILFETNNTGGIVSMVESTLCCGIIPGYYVRTPSPGVACFSLTGHPTWDMAVSYSYSAYLSSGAKEFIRLAKEYWA
ncbi:LysR family transcriptional regulator [Clostridium sp. AN503]|uniref:LysR family transcriptional regulator n=1 Tax=Clostridium sp. AN503 TaxID=3160598 RepID=UPI003459FF87